MIQRNLIFILLLASLSHADAESELRTFWGGPDLKVIKETVTTDCQENCRDHSMSCDCSADASQFSEGKIGSLPARIVKAHYHRNTSTNHDGTVYFLASYIPSPEIGDGAYAMPHLERTLLSYGGDFRYVLCIHEGDCSTKPGRTGLGFLETAKKWGYTGKLPSP